MNKLHEASVHIKEHTKSNIKLTCIKITQYLKTKSEN